MSERRQREDELSSEEDSRTSSTSTDEEESSVLHQRDLTNEEIEKLVQLQDLTGIDDLQICRALLESKGWDLEATAREHLNLPSRPLETPPPSPPVEAPNARSVMLSRPNNAHRRTSVIPFGHTVFSWAMYLIKMPFRLTYRTVYGVFDLFLSIFGLLGVATAPNNGTGRRRISNNDFSRPEEDVADFIADFDAKYGRDHVPFHSGSYSRALEEAKRDLRFLLVYLHCPSHQDTEQFCRQTLASPILKAFAVNMNVIVWACSVETSEGYRVSQALRESCYPFLALIVLRQNKMMVVGRVEGGYMTPEALCERLEIVIRDNEAYIVAASAERAERNINAEIRQEQDAAFQETLRMDQERERLKREAEEAKRREEEEERARQQAEVERKETIRRQKIELASEIPEEPNQDDQEAVRIVIKLPEGQRLERRFYKHQSLKYLYYYVFCHPDSPDEFDITTNFPRKVLNCKPSEEHGDDPPTFEEAGLGKSTMLFVTDLEA